MTTIFVNIRKASANAVRNMHTAALATIHGISEYELRKFGLMPGGGARADVTARADSGASLFPALDGERPDPANARN